MPPIKNLTEHYTRPAWVRRINAMGSSVGGADKLIPLDPDQALVMRGRFPRCRFANVVLWNHRLQTPPYRYRRVSLNRRQVRYERDGSFQIVVAHRDPGVPNWIDAAGLRTGMIFWRFLLPEEEVPPIEAEVVDVSSLS